MLAGSRAFQPVEVDHDFPGRRPTDAASSRPSPVDARSSGAPGSGDVRGHHSAQTGGGANDLRAMAERKDGLRAQRGISRRGSAPQPDRSFSWRVSTDEITCVRTALSHLRIRPGMPVTLELIGTRVHPEDTLLLQDMIERARGTGTDFEYEHGCGCPTGRSSTCTWLLTAPETRRTTGVHRAVQDVTARRLSDQALGKAQSELAHVARVTALSTLTASIAHEVNQPLSGIITNASTCLRMLAADPPDVDGARETARRTIRDGNRGVRCDQASAALFTKKEWATESVDLTRSTREVVALLLSELQRKPRDASVGARPRPPGSSLAIASSSSRWS